MVNQVVRAILSIIMNHLLASIEYYHIAKNQNNEKKVVVMEQPDDY